MQEKKYLQKEVTFYATLVTREILKCMCKELCVQKIFKENLRHGSLMFFWLPHHSLTIVGEFYQGKTQD